MKLVVTALLMSSLTSVNSKRHHHNYDDYNYDYYEDLYYDDSEYYEDNNYDYYEDSYYDDSEYYEEYKYDNYGEYNYGNYGERSCESFKATNLEYQELCEPLHQFPTEKELPPTTSPVTMKELPPTTTPLPPGGVLLMGGKVNGNLSGNVELIGNCDVAIVDLPEAVRSAAAAIKDGSVFHCGGRTGSGFSNRCYIRGESGVWTQGPSMNTARGFFTLNSVGSKLVAIGGWNGGGLDTAEVLESSVWKVAGFKINPGRSDHCAVTISDSSVLLVGGIDGGYNYLKTTEELNIDSGAVTPYADLPYGIIRHACALYNLQILVSGGDAGDKTSVYSLDYRSEGSDWVLLNHMEYGRDRHTMHVVNGVLTVYGGEGGGESTLEEMVQDSSWVSKPMKNRKYWHSSIVLC